MRWKTWLLSIVLAVASSVPVWAQVSLVEAVQSGDIAAATEMIRAGVDVDAPAPDGTTALHWAVHHDGVDLVYELLEAGADPVATNDYGATPMGEAAVRGNVEVIRALLDAGADVESPNADGQTTLMVIAGTSNLDAARLLIERGADVNRVEGWRGQTALMRAAAQGQPAMIKELIAHGADLDARSMVNDWQRQVTGEPRAIYRPAGGLTPLLFAARQGCVECARILVEAEADLEIADPEGVTPLIMALVNGHYDTAAYLVSAGADPDRWDWWGRTPLWAAVDMNTLPHGGRPDQPSLDETRGLQVIELLLEAGVNPNPQLKLLPPYRSMSDRGADGMLTIGATPLLRAAKALDAPAIRLLLEAGARPDIPTLRGVLPVTAAAGLGSRDGDTRGWFTTTDVEERSIAALQLLLDTGVDVNTADGGSNGRTALHGAAAWGWNDVIQFLVDQGADINRADSGGMTPLDAAMGRTGRRGPGEVRPETAALIERLGGVAGNPTSDTPGLGLPGR